MPFPALRQVLGVCWRDRIAPQRAGAPQSLCGARESNGSVGLTRFARAQLEALRRDEGRLAGENSALRAALLAAEEAADAAAQRHGEEKRGLEARVAELLFWKSRTVERHSTLEQARSHTPPALPWRTQRLALSRCPMCGSAVASKWIPCRDAMQDNAGLRARLAEVLQAPGAEGGAAPQRPRSAMEISRPLGEHVVKHLLMS